MDGTRRRIIHVDMDAFYAAVEQRDRPELRGRPVVVGGLPDSRAVVCTASYEARRFGVRSAMPCSRAARLCPEAVFVPPRFGAYQEVSRRLHGIFADYTDRIEPLSLDEAYLDVTENRRGEPLATPIAREIRARIRTELELTGSAGVSFNKFLAKVGSDLRKPDGLSVIPPERALAVIDTLPTGRFFGVGPVTERRLLEMGLRTGADLRAAGPERLEAALGRLGRFLHGLSEGCDDREVEASRERRSTGAEDTFERDLTDPVELRERLAAVVDKLLVRLGGRPGGRTVTLKAKYADFRQVTRSRTFERPVQEREPILGAARDLLRDTEAGIRPIRLLGVQLSHFSGEPEPGGEPEPWLWPQLELPLEE